MKLSDARKLFESLRGDPTRILVTRHAVLDHAERAFTEKEIRDLVGRGGRLADNKASLRATTNSFFLERSALSVCA